MADQKPEFTSRQMLLASTVLFVAALWALTSFLRDSLRYATINFGPLGSFPCDEGWIPFAAAVGVALLPQLVLYVKVWLSTGKAPSFKDEVLGQLKQLVAAIESKGGQVVQTVEHAGAALETAAAERPPAAAPPPPAEHPLATAPAPAAPPAHHA